MYQLGDKLSFKIEENKLLLYKFDNIKWNYFKEVTLNNKLHTLINKYIEENNKGFFNPETILEYTREILAELNNIK